MDFEQLRTMVSKAVGSRHIEDGTVYQYNGLMADIMKAVWPAIEQGNAARKSLADVLTQDFAEDCQECGIGQTDAWAKAKALQNIESGAGQTDRRDDDCDAVVIVGHRAAEQQPDVTLLVEALEEIIHPVRFMQERLEEGERLNGMAAVQLAEDASYLRGIAIAALAAYRKGGDAK